MAFIKLDTPVVLADENLGRYYLESINSDNIVGTGSVNKVVDVNGVSNLVPDDDHKFVLLVDGNKVVLPASAVDSISK